MFPIEREKEILRIIDCEGKASVETLAELTGASEMTIRRDLERMDKRGIIIRTHGGAVRRDYLDEAPFINRDAQMRTEKSAVAKRASGMISEGAVIFADSSTTVMRVVPFLTDKNVTVITNGLMTAAECGKYSVRAICSGGALNGLSYTLTGIEAVKCAQRYRADMFLFSCKGIDGYGIYESTAEVCAVKEAMAASAAKNILLADYSKINVAGKVRLDIRPDIFITDGDPAGCAVTGTEVIRI